MTIEAERGHNLTRRFFMLGAGKLVLTGALVGRLGYLQLFQHTKYKTLSDGNRIQTQMTPPIRGKILDARGEILAESTKSYQMIMVKNQVPNLEDVLGELRRQLSLSPGEMERLRKDLARTPKFMPVLVRSRLKWDDVLTFEVNAFKTPGVSIIEGYNRVYPLGTSCCHVVGYVSHSDEDDVDDPSDIVGLRKGRSGVEYVKQEELVGTPGMRNIEVNARGQEVRELEQTPPIHGEDTRLTIDWRLQKITEDVIQDSISASAVLMDVHTGHIKTMVSLPAFDPNIFPDYLTSENWKVIQENPCAPMTNKAVIGQYAPASTFKMVTALAALGHKGFNPERRIHCPGHLVVGNRPFHCYKKEGHGGLNLVEAIAKSCDVYFYSVALTIGIERIAETAMGLGLGQATGIELVGEKKGFVPTKDWKKKRFNQPWTPGDTVNSCIGQGYMLTTPLQLAVMTARLCNGGKAVQPSLILNPQQNIPRDFAPLMFPPEHLKLVLQGMNDAVNWPSGNMFARRIIRSGFEMAGKTGTAQVKGISKREREAGVVRQEHLQWKRRDHALFVGYAPAHKPKYAAAVVVEHGGWGGLAAVPVAREMLYQAQVLEV